MATRQKKGHGTVELVLSSSSYTSSQCDIGASVCNQKQWRVFFFFPEFVMVESSSLNFAFSLPLTVKWQLSIFSLNFFSLNQLKSGIDSSSSDLVRVSTLVYNVRGVVVCITCKVSIVKQITNKNVEQLHND